MNTIPLSALRMILPITLYKLNISNYFLYCFPYLCIWDPRRYWGFRVCKRFRFRGIFTSAFQKYED